MQEHDTAAPARWRFDAVLRPHRSLGPRGFVILMAAVGGIGFAAGCLFMAMGAWPVFGFFGLDVLAIWLAFRLNYRAARQSETVQVGDEVVLVRRIAADGRVAEWRFQPYWLRVEVREDAHGRGAVALASHGHTVRLGSFLTSEERRGFAEALRGALGEARDPSAGLPA